MKTAFAYRQLLFPILLLSLGFGPQRGLERPVPTDEESDFQVRIDYPHSLPLGSVKVVNDRVYLLLSENQKVLVYNRNGELENDIYYADQVGVNRAVTPPWDFAAMPDGEVVLVTAGTDEERVGLVFFDKAGRYHQTVLLDPDARGAKAAASADGNLFLLATYSPRGAGAKSVADRAPEPRLLRVNPGDLSVTTQSPVFASTRRSLANSPSRKQAWSTLSDSAPFAADSHGNRFFQLSASALAVASASGVIQEIPLPDSNADVQLLQSVIVEGDHKPIAVLVEGRNEAPVEEQLRGRFLLSNPRMRLFSLDPESGVFSEFWDLPRAITIAGRFSDGTFVTVRKRRNDILLSGMRLSN